MGIVFLYLHGQCFMSCVCPATQFVKVGPAKRYDMFAVVILQLWQAWMKKLYLSLLQMPTCPLLQLLFKVVSKNTHKIAFHYWQQA